MPIPMGKTGLTSADEPRTLRPRGSRAWAPTRAARHAESGVVEA